MSEEEEEEEVEVTPRKKMKHIKKKRKSMMDSMDDEDDEDDEEYDSEYDDEKPKRKKKRAVSGFILDEAGLFCSKLFFDSIHASRIRMIDCVSSIHLSTLSLKSGKMILIKTILSNVNNAM